MEAVEDDVEVLVGGLPLAVRVDLWPGKDHALCKIKHKVSPTRTDEFQVDNCKKVKKL